MIVDDDGCEFFCESVTYDELLSILNGLTEPMKEQAVRMIKALEDCSPNVIEEKGTDKTNS